MDCDLCGRYRASSEIAAWLDANGRFVMACGRCRRLGAGQCEPKTLALVTADRPAPVLTTVVPRR